MKQKDFADILKRYDDAMWATANARGTKKMDTKHVDDHEDLSPQALAAKAIGSHTHNRNK